MDKPVGILIYYDYLFPWCYIAAIRLQKKMMIGRT